MVLEFKWPTYFLLYVCTGNVRLARRSGNLAPSLLPFSGLLPSHHTPLFPLFLLPPSLPFPLPSGFPLVLRWRHRPRKGCLDQELRVTPAAVVPRTSKHLLSISPAPVLFALFLILLFPHHLYVLHSGV